MSFQTPEEIKGVTLAQFLKSTKQSITGEKPSIYEFIKEVENNMNELNMKEEYILKEYENGTKVTVSDLHKEVLTIMDEINRVCKKNNIKYLYLNINVPVLPTNPILKAAVLAVVVLAVFHLMYFLFNVVDKKRRKI